MKRRDFLKTSAVAAFGLTTASVHSKVLGANEKVRIGIIGVGLQGSYHVTRLIKMPDVQLIALADADPGYKMGQLQKDLAANEIPINVDIYTDYRKLLDRKDIDAVVIASCNHWHTLHAIHALQAGKHVYVEKPVSHDIWQGRQLVNMAKKSGLVVQVGMQHRSRVCWPEAMEYVKGGHLGKMICSRGLCYKERNSIGLLDTPLTPPPTCDYDLWLGPAQDEPIMRPQFHYDWHWAWNTGGGEIANNGVHQIDIARWMLGQNGFSPNVLSIAGRFGYKDAGQTPNTHIVFFDYKPVPLIFEVRSLHVDPGIRAMPLYKKTRVGNVIECEGGYIAEETIYDNQGKKIGSLTAGGDENHLPKFIEAVRSNTPDNLPISIGDAHISAALCHMGNISHRIGTKDPKQQISDMVKSDALKAETWQRLAEHLEVHKIDLDKEQAVQGAALSFDGESESFTGPLSGPANYLLRDNYRPKYQVPEININS